MARADTAATIDSLTQLMEQTSGTVEGIRYADELANLALELDSPSILSYAVGQKLTMLLAMARYDDVQTYVDSLTTHFSQQTNNNYAYELCYATYIRIISYIEQGKLKTAMQLAERLYDESKSEIIDHNGVDISTSVHCNALACIGLVNSNMGNHEAAIASFTEGIELIDDGDNADHLWTQKLDLQTYRMQAAQKLPDREKALEYIEQYTEELHEFDNEQDVNPLIENVFIGDCRLLAEIAYIDVLGDQNEFISAVEHVMTADSLIATYDMLEQYSAELCYAKSKLYQNAGMSRRAIDYADSAYSYYQAKHKLPDEMKSLRVKLTAYNSLGLTGSLYPIMSKILQLNDTINKQQYDSQLADMQTLMNVDKLEQQNQKIRSEQQILEQKAATLTAQRQMIVFIMLSAVLAMGLGFIMFKRKRDREKQLILSRQKEMLEAEVERQTRQLRDQNEEIEQTNSVLADRNEMIEKQNREITDSINYARRIQRSILPNLSEFSGTSGSGGAFAFFVPCNIVSGDFYWARSRGELDMFVCADCTGHGVPGAFMSMIGTTILNDLCDHSATIEPAEVLENLHSNLLNILQQNGKDDSKDGMDMALMVFNRTTRQASFAAARRPVYYFHEGARMPDPDVTVKRSIGERDFDRGNRPFRSATVRVEPGDTFYMCSDGLGDLFGGPKSRRFMSKRVEEMMARMVALPIQEQEKYVHDTYVDWMSDSGRRAESDYEQFDDILFMGIRL